MVWGHHLQLRFHPPLFHDFQPFNVKAAAAHHPVIQKEVDELLAKGAIEPSSGGTGFCSSVLVVPKHTGALHTILNLKCFNHFMHIPSFKMPTLKTYGSLSSRVILLFALIYRMLIYMFPLLSIIFIFYILFGIMCLISGRFYPLGLPRPLGFLHPSLHQLEWLAKLQQSPVPLHFPLPDVVIATDATPTHWAFYFQGSGLPLSVSGAWSGSLSRAHIALLLPSCSIG